MFATSKFGSPGELFDLTIPVSEEKTSIPSVEPGRIKESTQENKLPETTDNQEIETPPDPKVKTTEDQVDSQQVDASIEENQETDVKTPDEGFTEEVVLSAIAEDLSIISGHKFEKEEITDLNTFYQSLEQKIIDKRLSEDGDLRNQLKEEVIADLGLTEQNAYLATGIEYGIDRKSYTEALALKRFTDFEFTKETTQDTTDLFQVYYKLNKMPDRDAKRAIENDLKSEDVEDLIKERKEWVDLYATGVVTNVETTIEERKKKAIKFNQERRSQVESLLRTGIVGGNKYPYDKVLEFREAMTKKTETVTFPDGRTQKVSKYQKKLMERSVEDELKQAMSFYFGEDIIKKETETERQLNKRRGSFINKLNKDLKPLSNFEATTVENKVGEKPDAEFKIEF
jgi:hypothetical protein